MHKYKITYRTFEGTTRYCVVEASEEWHARSEFLRQYVGRIILVELV